MLLFTRKLLYLFFLSNMVFCSLKGQMPIPIGTIGGTIINSLKPVKLFKPYKFDSSDVIIGFDFFDSANGRYKKYSFILDNTHDLDEIKKSWIFKYGAQPVSGQGVFKVYYVRNKTIRKSWNIFPESKSIITDDGYCLFDTSMLSTLHAKNPLVYSIRTDTLTSKNDFLRFYDSVKANSSFLFLIEPNIVNEGSFDVQVKAGSRISPEVIGERIISICDKIKPKTPFKVYLKPGDGTSDTKQRMYVVRCDKSLFEHFSDAEMEKSDWAPATYTIQSFWRE